MQAASAKPPKNPLRTVIVTATDYFRRKLVLLAEQDQLCFLK